MPTAPGYAKCSYEIMQTGLTRPAYVTFGVDSTDTDPSLVASQLLSAWSAAGSLNTLMDSTTTMTAVRVSIGTDGGGDLVYILAAAVAGGGTSLTTLPPNCAVLFHKTSSLGGRRGRGRMYLPWSVGEGNVDEAGIIGTTQVTAHSAAATSWRTALATGGNPLVILHEEGKTAIPAPSPVVTMVADRIIATQRRRLGR